MRTLFGCRLCRALPKIAAVAGMWLIGLRPASASPFANILQTLTQPSGEVFSCFVSGDEYFHWLHDAEGFVIVQDELSGFYSYAVKIDGRLQPSECAPTHCDPMAFGLAPGLRPDPEVLAARRALFGTPEPSPTATPAAAPRFTRINHLFIFVRFSDQSEFTSPLPTFDSYLNSTSSASVYGYFQEASYGQVAVSTTFYPTPNGSTVISFQDSHARNYYLPYNATSNPTGYREEDYFDRAFALLAAAVDAVAPQIPTTLDLDTNNDGEVDAISILIRGTSDPGNLLWAQRISSGGVITSVNGKIVNEFMIEIETMPSGYSNASTTCHEMSHQLGAPDLYHYEEYSSNPGLDPVGRWDIMAWTLSPPQHSGAYMKRQFLGFLTDIPEITSSGRYTLNPITSATNNAYKIASPTSSFEYFVVEYRRRVGTYESKLPGSGLLVYRINPNVGTGLMCGGNKCGPPDQVYVYRPGGTNSSNGTIAYAPLSANTGRVAINDYTDPPSFLTAGGPGGLSIFDVSEAGDTISFSVGVGDCPIPGTFQLVSPALGASVPAASSVTLSWAESASATSYDVYLGTSFNPPLFGSATTNAFTVPVTPGQTYTWKVVARNSCGVITVPLTGNWYFQVDATPRPRLRSRVPVQGPPAGQRTVHID